MVDRIVRERGSVGRRIWRRRKRRVAAAASDASASSSTSVSGTAQAAPDGMLEIEEDVEEEEQEDLDEGPFPEPLPAPPTPAPKKGFFASLFGRSDKAKAPVEPPYLVVDPTRDVLAVPRGAARLDAFERAIRTTPTGTPQFRALALAFHKELHALADHAGVDLSLYETRVEACAQALIAANEEERAGTLFLRVGRRHQAAELFVAAGAIDALEEAHAQIQWDEGGARQEARLAFERFEALFLVGMREPALLSLEKAHRLWKDNAVYAEIFRTFQERLGKPFRLSLSSGKQELVLVGKWPVILGRGEDVEVRLQSPLISRAHLQIELAGDTPVVVDLESRGGTRVGQAPLVGRQALSMNAERGPSIDMAGVVVDTALRGGALWLSPALAPEQRTLAALGARVTIPAPGSTAAEGVTVRFDAKGRAVVEQPATLNGEPLRRPTLLLEGDKVGVAGWTWTVARR
jgi:tetratricopeptide (TPR) repeat protein